MFMMTWSMMEAVATHRSAPPYLAVTAGPISHSPLPMEVPSKIAPGPMTAMAVRNENGGGAGRSACSQAGSVRASAPIDHSFPGRPCRESAARLLLQACTPTAHGGCSDVGDVAERDGGGEPAVQPEPEHEA